LNLIVLIAFHQFVLPQSKKIIPVPRPYVRQYPQLVQTKLTEYIP